MTEKNMAVEVAKRLIELQEHIDALKSALKTKYGWSDREMAVLDSEIFDLESQNRRVQPSPSQSAQAIQAIEDASDDTPLVPLLYQTVQTMTV